MLYVLVATEHLTSCLENCLSWSQVQQKYSCLSEGSTSDQKSCGDQGRTTSLWVLWKQRQAAPEYFQCAGTKQQHLNHILLVWYIATAKTVSLSPHFFIVEALVEPLLVAASFSAPSVAPQWPLTLDSGLDKKRLIAFFVVAVLHHCHAATLFLKH